MQAAADWLVDDDGEAASQEEREAAWGKAEAAAERQRAARQADLRAVRQQLCDRCVCCRRGIGLQRVVVAVLAAAQVGGSAPDCRSMMCGGGMGSICDGVQASMVREGHTTAALQHLR